MRKVLVHLKSDDKFHAGSKAMEDCEKILCNRGYELLKIEQFAEKNSMGAKLRKELEFMKFFTLRRGDILAIQHPLYIGVRYIRWIALAKKIRKFKTMFIVHDLESLRGLFPEYSKLFRVLDDKMLQIGDIMIAHNERMMRYLIEERNVNENKLVNLKLFDYLVRDESAYSESIGLDKGIAIAGNFTPEKSGYVYQLHSIAKGLSFNIYGVNYNDTEHEVKDIHYVGAFAPDELPEKLCGEFGLVWDGTDTETCKSDTGNYMRYNNPHKVSLYVTAALPIIIWKEAALADFVIEHKIGIGISSLGEIREKIDKISVSDYQEMQENIRKISEQVRRGDFIANACEEGELRLLEKNNRGNG